MILSREELALCHSALQNQADSLREHIASLTQKGFGHSRGTKELRESLFTISVLRNKIEFSLTVPSATLPSDSACNRKGCNHVYGDTACNYYTSVIE